MADTTQAMIGYHNMADTTQVMIGYHNRADTTQVMIGYHNRADTTRYDRIPQYGRHYTGYDSIQHMFR